MMIQFSQCQSEEIQPNEAKNYLVSLDENLTSSTYRNHDILLFHNKRYDKKHSGFQLIIHILQTIPR